MTELTVAETENLHVIILLHEHHMSTTKKIIKVLNVVLSRPLSFLLGVHFDINYFFQQSTGVN